MGLKTPEKIGKLQRSLYAKAKEQPELRSHQLYDKVWREDILELAYRKCKANGGAAGVGRALQQSRTPYFSGPGTGPQPLSSSMVEPPAG